MNNKMLILTTNIRQDMATIAEIYKMLAEHPINEKSSDDVLIVVAYYLHNLYNAFENIFQNIAATFENSIDDKSQWHAQLLQRMCLNMMPLRPAVINDTSYDALDELRRFRHLFRHAYGIKLDVLRLELVLKKAMVLKPLYATQLEAFLTFLRSL